MKTLSLSKPLILILIGLPGSGKSFFAEKFSEMFASPLVSYDRIRFELFTSPKFTPNEFEIITRLADYQMAELVKTKRSFIVDGGGNTFAERQKLQRLAKASSYDTLLIWAQTDDLTCRKRALSRNPNGADVQSPNLTEQQWANQAKRFNQPTREHYMVISGKHAFSTQAKMVLRKLTTPHTEAAQTAHKEQTQVRQAASVLPKRTVVHTERPVSPPRRNVVIS